MASDVAFLRFIATDVQASELASDMEAVSEGSYSIEGPEEDVEEKKEMEVRVFG